MQKEEIMIPSIGRIVHYRLTDQDAVEINRRRTSGSAITEQLKSGAWPRGAQAHIGNQVAAGDTFPAMIVRTWGSTEGSACQLQVFLDGNDTYWATSRNEGGMSGMWCEPARVGTSTSKTKREIELEDLLVSARSICQRKGADTAWERFDARIASLGIGHITAKVFKILPSDTEAE
jgi:hypothetical protein